MVDNPSVDTPQAGTTGGIQVEGASAAGGSSSAGGQGTELGDTADVVEEEDESTARQAEIDEDSDEAE